MIENSFLILYTAVTFSLVLVFVLINEFSVAPYMDEIFHVPQADAYCNGRFDIWDPKITTFPGLYVWTAGISAVLSPVMNLIPDIDIPSLIQLRFVNLIFATLLFPAFYTCRKLLYNGGNEDALAIALLLFFYPFSWFYNFLYYTDTTSTFSLVLLLINTSMLTATVSFRGNSVPLHGQHLASFVCCLATISIRQTNAVWVAFCAGTTILHYFKTSFLARRENSGLSGLNLIGSFFWFLLWGHLYETLCILWSFIVPLFLFISFVVYNRGIVVGDKEHHVPVLHIAMVFHGLFIAAAVLAPISLATVVFSGKKEKSLSQRLIMVNWIVPLSLLTLFIHQCLVVSAEQPHPFILADNRHYVFYVWKRVLSQTKFLPHIAVVYAICFAFLMHQFSSVYTAVEFPLLEIKEDSANVPKADADTSVSSLSNGSDHRDKRMVSTTSHPNTAHSLYCSILFITIYLVAICISLAPAHLIEVRYFTPAVMILILRTPFKISFKAALSMVALFCLINMLVMYIFLYKPFFWPDGSVARFMY